MFATRFPDLNWLKEQAERRSFRGRLPDGSPGPPAGWPTVILNVETQNIYRDNIPGPLSLFSNWSGQSTITAGRQRLAVPDDCFVITNPGQRYTLEVGNRKAETLNIHFGELWAAEAFNGMKQTHDQLLDQAKLKESQFGFYNKLFRKTNEVSLILRQLQHHANGGSFRRDELLVNLLELLVAEQQRDYKRADTLAAVKGSTRKEIMRRIYLATDHVFARPEGTHSLDELARISMLSKFHFLRAFKEAFNKTPHQFITEFRMERAIDLLTRTNLEVAEIGRKVGFDTASTFSRTFRNVTGRYPTQFRSRK